MKISERVVKSVPDRSGQVYARMESGGRGRMTALVNYMDERQTTQLHTMEHGASLPTDRYQAQDAVTASESRYVQHLVVTTSVQASGLYYDAADVAERVGRAIQKRRPDAEIYAIAVHGDGDKGERHLHVHVAVGTQTTLRRGDLEHFREQAAVLEQQLARDNGRQFLEHEQVPVQEHRYRLDYEQEQQR